MTNQPSDGPGLLSAGLFAHRDAIASVVERFGVPGSPDPARVLTARVFGGFDVDVLPSRGLDIGDCWFRGLPLSWRSPVRDARAVDMPQGEQWVERFTGGLLATCGTANIGPAREGYGLHGDFDHRPARDVSTVRDDGVTIRGTIEIGHLFQPSLSVDRTIRIESGQDAATITVTDEVENVSLLTAPVAMLYHLNLGAPLVVPGTTVDIAAERVASREPVPQVPTNTVLPEPCDAVTEAVFEHIHPVADADGLGHAAVVSPGSGLRFDLSWTADTLPRLIQWIFPTRGRWVLGVEPGTAPLFGPDRESPSAGIPTLEPGGTRRQQIRIAVSAA